MARKLRIDYPGAWHHVTHRGARREPIFHDDGHCVLFLACLEAAAARHECEIHAYALMPNHYHLLLRSVAGNLSRCMQHLNGRYTQQLNERHGWDGPVFRGRFHNEVVEDDDYLRAVCAYIHLNPVRAGLATRPEVAHWSSFPSYVGDAPAFDWLRRDEMVALFGSLEDFVSRTGDLHRGAEPWPEGFDLTRGRLVGWRAPRAEDADFAREERPRPTPDAILAEVSRVTGWPRSALVRKLRGRGGNPPRRLAAWALATLGGLPQREVGRLLGMSAAHAGNTIIRLRRRTDAPPFARWMDALREWHAREAIGGTHRK